MSNGEPVHQQPQQQHQEQSFTKIDFRTFYGQWHGHPEDSLRQLADELRKPISPPSPSTDEPVGIRAESRAVCWLSGDSSLDCKYWVGTKPVKAANGYEKLLQPPFALEDVCYHINKEMTRRDLASSMCCINAAVEETTVRQRKTSLLAQDEVIRDNIRENDILVVSVGGNDIAFPTIRTAWNMFKLIHCNSLKTLDQNPASAWGFPHLRNLFGARIKDYVERMILKQKPKLVVVCMIYFPDENDTPSWASAALKALNYNRNPAKLQAAIRAIYSHATTKIEIEGTTVVGFPVFEYLDGRTSSDYVARVEPSSQGALKMARGLLDVMEKHLR